jgi:N-acyl-D-aspartate/D-glutamate deacylase
MHDIVIRGGKVLDGSGEPARTADIAIRDGKIQSAEGRAGAAQHEIDADGLLVTPGWVDIHTHYDGQATWDPFLSPSSWHGVTSVVMGNCGVGFAPARAERHDWLIGLMEGVEDIPGAALSQGIDWAWESFPQYLDALDGKPLALDIGAQVPHGAVRAYVMGERGACNEPATEDDVREMGAIVEEGLRAGALGFTTSRTVLHRSIEGVPVPGTYAGEEELFAIGRALSRAGTGVFEMASDLMPEARELDWVGRLSREVGRPITFALLQNDLDPSQWQRILQITEAANAEGSWVVPQVAGRPAGLLLGLEATIHPFVSHGTYKALRHLPLAERVAELRKPEVKAKMLAEEVTYNFPLASYITSSFHKLFPLGDPPNYEPAPEASVKAIAEREGRAPADVAYDLLLERGGRELLYFPLFGYSQFDFEPIREMLLHPQTRLGLSDGGAHCGVICDASTPTFMLTHWTRDRSRGERLPLEWVVANQTRKTAELYGMRDRGLLAPGMKADVNVIDYDALSLRPPEMVYDLPGDSRRLVQRASGYRATLVSGEVTFENGEATGALPGHLVRGEQDAP